MSHIPYASVVGSLMYAMVCTRPDLAQAVSVVSRHLKENRKKISLSRISSRYLHQNVKHVTTMKETNLLAETEC